MTDSDHWWEPPLAGTEAEHLVGTLDRLRTTFRWKTDDLDAGGLQARIGASSLTLGGLLKHLARAEEQMFSTKLSGALRHTGHADRGRAGRRGPSGWMARNVQPTTPAQLTGVPANEGS
ncbi:DUF664 domain-containing protein [Nonomuraea basaltis]|uniref:mycothiol transferase n=1 Tax=Nonomuraea basaltis TaxID=2495887 RepID=UPI00110C48EE|nr:DUF664 domain-containing protein [Nonomuraea basaltis]TMR97440.1 DUF664 domain-containing protein [Nonomuraea basaltis]